MTSPLARVPRAIQVMGLIESFMNFTLPSANRALTPPGWLLWAFENVESSGPQPGQPSRHEFHGCELGGATVLNSVIDMAPQPQRFPLALEMLVPVPIPAL